MSLNLSTFLFFCYFIASIWLSHILAFLFLKEFVIAVVFLVIPLFLFYILIRSNNIIYLIIINIPLWAYGVTWMLYFLLFCADFTAQAAEIPYLKMGQFPDWMFDDGGNGGPGAKDASSIAADNSKRNPEEDPSFFDLHESFSIQHRINQNGGRVGNIVSLPTTLFYPDENIYMVDPVSTKDFSLEMFKAYVKEQCKIGSRVVFFDLENTTWYRAVKNDSGAVDIYISSMEEAIRYEVFINKYSTASKMVQEQFVSYKVTRYNIKTGDNYIQDNLGSYLYEYKSKRDKANYNSVYSYSSNYPGKYIQLYSKSKTSMFLGDPFSNYCSKIDLNNFDLNLPAIEEVKGRSRDYLAKPGHRESICVNIQNNAFNNYNVLSPMRKLFK